MIHVDRRRVPAPAALQGDRAAAIRRELEEFYRADPQQRSQRRFDYDRPVGWLRGVLGDALLSLFAGKCAFCEQPIGQSASWELEMFRPKRGAGNTDGERSPDHYWWLTLEWENLFPACPACNRTKGSRFPVRGPRARIGAPWDEIRAEAALLLDPCTDAPEEHLVFSADGTVAAVHVDDLAPEELGRYGTPTRGQVTIDTFGLNRSELRELRRGEAAQFLDRLGALIATAGQDPAGFKRETETLLGADLPFLLMKRQLLARWIADHVAPTDRKRSDAFDIVEPSAGVFKTAGEQQRAFAQQAAWNVRVEGASVESADEAESYRARASYIERVEIRGFTSLQDLEISFVGPQTASGGDAPWLMLLGENGAGKTSVLKALALALAGERRLELLKKEIPGHRLAGLFRHDGYVRVFLSSHSEPLELRRSGDTLAYQGNPGGSKVFLRAFGPSRWFPLPDAPPSEPDQFVRITNLFNPFVPLESPERFLLDLDPGLWDEVAASLKDLLQITDGTALTREGGEIRLLTPGAGEAQPLRALSSGYEAVVAMAADLMHLLLQRWPSPQDAEGIVLLDEIDAHLHPRWKMRIVASLRRTFPRVQFIATTHEPLCLRGLRAGEILVMRRDGDALIAYRAPQDVSKLRIDQLLTSRMFGLHSTLAPELESQYDRYYDLLSRHETSLSPAERDELAGLRGALGTSGMLGSTRRDQVIYRIIDEFVARERSITDETERDRQEQLTRQQVAEFWTRIPDLSSTEP